MDNKALKKLIANKLYQARTECRITQSQLQEENIISQSHLSKVENGEIMVSAILLWRLAQKYNKSLEFFFEP